MAEKKEAENSSIAQSVLAEAKVVAIKKGRASRKFVIALSVVSIIGFLSIILSSLFYIDVSGYIDTLWLFTLGLGLVLEASLRDIGRLKEEGLSPEMLGKITMIIVGGISIIAGVFSLPQINIQNPSFLAIKGIISILAIIFIILQTWVTERK